MSRINKTAPLILLAAAFVLGSSHDETQGLKYTVVADSLGNPGAGVRLEWVEPSYNEGGLFSCSSRKRYPDYYVIYADGQKIGTTANTFYCVFDPCRAIEVSAVWDGEEDYPEMIDLSPTAPGFVDVWEVNGDRESGISFSPFYEYIYTCWMNDVDNQELIDCYFTDYHIGFGQVPYYLASPGEVSNDSGATFLPDTGWRVTGVSDTLGADLEAIQIAPATGYEAARPVIVGEVYAIRTQDDCYGLIRVDAINNANGEVYLTVMLQPALGLRWMVTK